MPVDFETAVKPIINDICKNGQEEAFRIWSDPTHPLYKAVEQLMVDYLPEFQKKAAAMEGSRKEEQQS